MCYEAFYYFHFQQYFSVILNNTRKNLQGSLYQTLVFEQQNYLGRLLLYHWVPLSTSLALQCPKINNRTFQSIFTSFLRTDTVTGTTFWFYPQHKTTICLKYHIYKRNTSATLARGNSSRSGQVWSFFVCYLKSRMKLCYLIYKLRV